MAEVLPGVLRLSAGNPGPLTGSGNFTYLCLGGTTTLIDAGVGEPAHLDAIAASLGPARSLQQVVVTHGHGDHTGGARALRGRWPEATFFKWPWRETDARQGVEWVGVGDGQLLAAGDLQLHVLHTPGHSPDHLCLWHEPSRTLFGGDLLIAGTTVVIPGTRGGDLSAYLQSLDAVSALRPARILPAHGPPIEDPVALIERYSAHRAARERDVIRALAEADGSATELTDRVYGSLAPAVQAAALESMHAHLNKLLAEGRVVRRGGHFHLIA